MTNKVFIATSLDGFIADINDGVDWLQTVPNPQQNDLGFHAFMDSIDALVMGRKTFELVDSFDVDWPYNKPVFVLSNTLSKLPDKYHDKAFLMKGEPSEIVTKLKVQGYKDLYIDGGTCIQNFLTADLIEEMIITTIPIVLGEGIPLFSKLPKPLQFRCVKSSVELDALVQNHYVRHDY